MCDRFITFCMNPCLQGSMEQTIEEIKPTVLIPTPFVSRLLVNEEIFHWEIHNFKEIVEYNCWSAISVSIEARGSLGRNYTWRFSLFGDEDYVYGRAELVLPVRYRIPYSLKFRILNKPEDSTFPEESEIGVREITNQSDPQHWKIFDMKYLPFLLRNDPEKLILRIYVKCYGSETSRGLEIQNFPY